MLRVGFFIGLLAIIGILVSGLVSYRIYEQEGVIDRAALTRQIDAHAGLVQERLSEREVLARVSAGAFQPSTAISANALQPLRPSIYTFKTNFVVTGWIAHLMPSDFPLAEAELKRAGFKNPQIRNFNDKPLDPAAAAKGVDVLMDVEPQDDNTLKLPGRAYDQHPVIGPTLAKATETGEPEASDPLNLSPVGGPLGVVLAVPVVKQGTKSPIGFITTSYRLSLMLRNDDLSLFSVALRDPRTNGGELVLDNDGEVVTAAARPEENRPEVRKILFGGRQWALD